MAIEFNRFKIVLQERSTGETKEVIVQTQIPLLSNRDFVTKTFADEGFNVLDVVKMNSIVKIEVDVPCPN